MIHRPHGETNVTYNCQNRCVACNHFIPVQSPMFIDPEILRRDLNNLADIVHFDRYNLVGGEPTLHPRLLDLLRIVKESEISDSLEITTNGQAYKQWPDEMYVLIDELIVTPYKLTDNDKRAITEKCELFGTALQWHPVIFTEVAFKQPTSEESAHNRYLGCWYNVNRHVIDNGVFYRCCTSPFIPSILLGLGKEHDGIAIDGLTETRLEEYLFQAETPASCFVCAANCGRRLEWRETDREHWIEESLT